MKRKVAQIGPATLMVSLPSKWVKEQGLKKGTELEVEINNQKICFALEHNLKQKSITLDLTHFDKYLLARYLETLYLANYQQITLYHPLAEIFDNRTNIHLNLKSLIKRYSNRFIGLEIVSQTKTTTILKCFLLNQEQDLEQIAQRIHFLFKETLLEFWESLNRHHAQFHKNCYDHHDNVAKFITYYLRLLNQSQLPSEVKQQLYSLYSLIDKLVDKFRHASEKVFQYGCTPRIKQLIKEIIELTDDQFVALSQSKITTELITKRYALAQKIDQTDYNLKEQRIVTELKLFLDTLNDFSRAIIVQSL